MRWGQSDQAGGQYLKRSCFGFLHTPLDVLMWFTLTSCRVRTGTPIFCRWQGQLLAPQNESNSCLSCWKCAVRWQWSWTDKTWIESQPSTQQQIQAQQQQPVELQLQLPGSKSSVQRSVYCDSGKHCQKFSKLMCLISTVFSSKMNVSEDEPSNSGKKRRDH